MPRTNRPSKRDANQAQIEVGLKQLGISYHDTSALGKGFPDLVVGWNGVSYLLEIKKKCANPIKELTPAEQHFFASWSGHVAIVTTLEEIKREIGYGNNNE